MSEQFFLFLFYSLLITGGLALLLYLISYYALRPKQKVKYAKLYSLNLDKNSKTLHIKYELSEKTNVLVTIQDYAGKTIQKLADDEIKSGLYYIEYNISHLPHGDYFINITTHNINSFKKITI